MSEKISIAPIGIYFAKKCNKIKINGGNSMPLTEKDIVLTTEEAIEYLKISKPTFLKYIRLGRIRATKAGKGWRILLSELNRFLKGEVS
jgi:excisionase family DNA binding protein